MIQWTRGGWLESAESQRGALKLQLESPTTHEHLSHRREKLESYLQISTKIKWEKNQPPTAALPLLSPLNVPFSIRRSWLRCEKMPITTVKFKDHLNYHIFSLLLLPTQQIVFNDFYQYNIFPIIILPPLTSLYHVNLMLHPPLKSVNLDELIARWSSLILRAPTWKENMRESKFIPECRVNWDYHGWMRGSDSIVGWMCWRMFLPIALINWSQELARAHRSSSSFFQLKTLPSLILLPLRAALHR